MHKLATLALSFLFLGVPSVRRAIAQQTAPSCPNPIAYESHNQITPPPLSLRKISGRAVASDGVSVSNVCLGLYTEKDHRLVASAVADNEGYFQIRKIPAGRYRLAVKDRYGGFCTANVPIRISAWPRSVLARKRLVIHMRPAAIDTCSYGDYK
jgi:hypothetical protein